MARAYFAFDMVTEVMDYDRMKVKARRSSSGILPVCLKGIFWRGHGVSSVRFEGITAIRRSSF